MLGEGSYGTVYLVQNIRSNEKLAAKAFKKSKLQYGDKKSLLKNEIKVMRKLNHPNILKMHEVHETTDTIYVILEYIKDGELFNYIKNTKNIPKKVLISIMTQLISTVEYLESKCIVHRDIKPENIMIIRDGSDIELKLADFGLAGHTTSPDYYEAGTPGFMAPEILHPKKYPKEL